MRHNPGRMSLVDFIFAVIGVILFLCVTIPALIHQVRH